MSLFVSLRLVLLGLVLATAACKTYSTVSTKRLTYEAATPAGEIIAAALQRPARDPAVQLGAYLDAAARAGEVLRATPGDRQARTDYNFAVSRVMEVVHNAGMEPWKTPVRCPGAGGEWTFSYQPADRPERDPALFRILPADRYEFKGRLISERTVKEGLGAPLVVTSKGGAPVAFDSFAQSKNFYYGMTVVLDFRGRRCVASVLDPLASETVVFNGHRHPLAADFTAPLALALAELNPRKMEVERMFRPEQFKGSTRLARLQPYDPAKIPVLLIHGLGDSQATWAPMVESLRGDAAMRKNYQFWFFSYPTGYPYPLMAAVLREQMDAMNARYLDHQPIVVVGHSMGGMIARTLITDSGMSLWNAYFKTPPNRTPLSQETLEIMKSALIFRHRPEIARVIFASASLRGSDMATGFLGRLGARLIGSPADLSEAGQEASRLARPGADGTLITRMPNSVDALDPDNRFLITINELPTAQGIPYHSIIGDRGKGGHRSRIKPVSTDGLVPYWSSHIEGAESELIVPSDHWSNQHPQAIEEVRRILLEHLDH